ncbi:hypothetical protein [Streptomyces roseicoloratus]|uniref:DUF222 domain-containing protein n=1 Tax=Streptomyces roseicoloratus TaxID=2508722 RepID=A0ABY9S1J1_9ACTN|nr:hypothetical protein [Streptomyces roseicoloratus]WMX48296.1 hypothetical protein RGF97_30730 [Streptomyces roseicoloratus]
MNATEEDRLGPAEADVRNAKTTLVQLLARAGVYSGDAEELIGIVEAGALALAREELDALARDVPAGKGEPYTSGWGEGAAAVVGGLGVRAERILRQAVGAHEEEAEGSGAGRVPLPPVGRMELERAKVVVLPLYLSFSTVSDLDPEVSEQVLTAVLRTMTARERAGYADRLTRFAAAGHDRVERMYAEYGPGSPIAIHGRYSLLHSPASIAVLERLTTTPDALREEWDAAELPPAWLEGLSTAWTASGSADDLPA